MSLFFAAGSPTTEMSPEEVRGNLFAALDNIGARRRVLIVPPDFTRMHSQSGVLTELAAEFYGNNLVDVLPALGTHKPMSDSEIATMFGKTPRSLFRIHDWRNDIVTLGDVPGEFIHEVSEGKLDRRGASSHRLSNLLTHALGTNKQPSIDFGSAEALSPGDTFLICSDGLWHYFTDNELAVILSTYPPRKASERLIQIARERADGGGDNCTLAIVRMEPAEERHDERPEAPGLELERRPGL